MTDYGVTAVQDTSPIASGRLVGMWIKPARRQPMRAVEQATLVTNRGIVGNANQNGRRQVTVISQERWARAAQELGAPVDPELRRANFMVSGINLEQTRGHLLRIGEALIEIWGETRPCRLMDEQHEGLQDALDADWGGGVFGRILEGGTVQLGDVVQLLPAPLTAPYQNWKNSRSTAPPSS